MIIWLFALFDLVTAAILLLAHFDFLPWRVVVIAAVGLGGKAILFNDKMLSIVDIVVALYMILLVFISGSFFTWIFMLYFGYKILVSL